MQIIIGYFLLIVLVLCFLAMALCGYIDIDQLNQVTNKGGAKCK